MDIFEMLKNAGVEVPEDKKDAFNTEFRKTYKSEAEVTKKVNAAEADRDNWKLRAETAEGTLKGFEGKDFDEITKDRDAWKKKFETLENEQKEAAAKTERAQKIAEFLQDTVFVNDITKKAITSQLEEELSQDSAKGKSVEDLFNAIVKDKDGNLLPNIIVEESQRQAEQKRSTIVGRSLNGGGQHTKVTREEFLKMGIEERTKLKENDPDTYRALRGGR